jgi:hypothetical protein
MVPQTCSILSLSIADLRIFFYPGLWTQRTARKERSQRLAMDLRKDTCRHAHELFSDPGHQIIEGAITVLLGILVYFFVSDFPDKNTFLTPKQTELVLKRVEDDRGDSIPDEVTFKKILLHLTDWKLWVYGMLMVVNNACCSSLN